MNDSLKDVNQKVELQGNQRTSSALHRGFTLAEVLITLAIIGVVAAMTIPTVLNSFKKHSLKIAFKKAYSTATNAWNLALVDNPNTFTERGGYACTWPDGTSADYNTLDGRTDALKSKMKVAKTCVNEHGCWPEDYEFVYPLLGETKDTVNSPYKFSWVTADGMCWSNPYHGIDDVHLLVDTNCDKKPNKIGEDIFSMLLGKDGIIYFYIDDRSVDGKPVSSGGVCPLYNPPATINDRQIDFREMLE